MPTGIPNPYLAAAAHARFGAIPFAELREQLDAAPDAAAMHRLIERYMLARDRLVVQYAWAIPNAAALRALAAVSPLVEVGAGNGYWAWLLRRMGVDILAFDAHPPRDESHANGHCRNALAVGTLWTEVLPEGPEQAARHADRTLFLCWPPPDDPMAANALTAYHQAGGRRFAFVGEPPPVCGDDTFADALADDWHPIQHVAIPRWHGIKDALTIFERGSTVLALNGKTPASVRN